MRVGSTGSIALSAEIHPKREDLALVCLREAGVFFLEFDSEKKTVLQPIPDEPNHLSSISVRKTLPNIR
jgi:hypothetical protein